MKDTAPIYLSPYLALYHRAQFNDILFKGVAVDGSAFHLRAIVVNGAWRVEQQGSYFAALAHA